MTAAETARGRKFRRRTGSTRGCAACVTPRNSGQSAALWTGVLATNGAIIATLDGDLQNDPADLPKMFAELERVDFDVRHSGESARHLAPARFVAHRTMGTQGCARRGLSRCRLFAACIQARGSQRCPPLQRLASVSAHSRHGGGATTKEIPVNHRPRRGGCFQVRRMESARTRNF